MPARKKSDAELARVGRGPGRDSGGRPIAAFQVSDDDNSDVLAEYEDLKRQFWVHGPLVDGVRNPLIDTILKAESAMRFFGVADRKAGVLFDMMATQWIRNGVGNAGS